MFQKALKLLQNKMYKHNKIGTPQSRTLRHNKTGMLQDKTLRHNETEMPLQVIAAYKMGSTCKDNRNKENFMKNVAVVADVNYESKCS